MRTRRFLLMCNVVAWSLAGSARTFAGPPDFNGDGYSDLAISAPGAYRERQGCAPDGGVVYVLYGSANGLTATGNQEWSQDSPGIADSGERGDDFGRTLAWGDFDGDNIDDLLIGVPYESITTTAGLQGVAGAVHVLYGSRIGLTAKRSQLWHQSRPGIEEAAETYDSFGYVMVVGDFNGDARDDLAVGVPRESIGRKESAGGVTVIYGSDRGLSAAGSQFWSEDSAAVAGTARADDGFGAVLAVADFDGDGCDELAIGSPTDSVQSQPIAQGLFITA
jgi:hypothetical protein